MIIPKPTKLQQISHVCPDLFIYSLSISVQATKRKLEREQRKDQSAWEEKINSFVEVMSNMIRSCKNKQKNMPDPKCLNCYRSIGTKRIVSEPNRKPAEAKRRRAMETNTPVAYRHRP